MTTHAALLLAASLPPTLRRALDRRTLPARTVLALARRCDPGGLLAPAVAAYLTLTRRNLR